MDSDELVADEARAATAGSRSRASIAPLRFRADIEGLRGVAVLLVVLFHAGVDRLAGGYVGVDVFFVLSGFLISALLLGEVTRTERIGFADFYARRFRRLLPALLAVTFASLVAATLLASPLDVREWTRTALSVPTFTSNLLFAHRAGDYLGGDLDHQLFLNMWSLAVEEQFYLVWPVLLLVAARLGRGRPGAFVGVVGAVTLASAVVGVALTTSNQPVAFFGPISRFWEFGVGALLALVPLARAPRRAAAVALSLVGLAMVAAAALRFGASTPYPGTAAALPVAGTALILLGGLDPAVRANPLLELGPVRWLGSRSYSWYLWHWPLLVLLDVVRPSFGVVPGLLVCAVALAAADLTFRWIEDPVRHATSLARDPRRTVRLGLGAIVASVVLLLGLLALADVRVGTGRAQAYADAAEDVHEVFENGCVAGFSATEPLPAEDCTYGAPDGDRTVVLFGDSHAAQWVPALDEVGREAGVRVVLSAKSSCPSADVTVRADVYRRDYDECDAFRAAALEQIDALDPDVVVVSNFSVYLDKGIEPAAWEAGVREVLERVASPGRAVAVLHDVPTAPFSVPDCLARQAALVVLQRSDCTFARSTPAGDAATEAERRAAAAAGARAVATATEVCAQERCEPVVDGTVVYFDSSHLTASAAAELGPWLGEQLELAPAG